MIPGNWEKLPNIDIAKPIFKYFLETNSYPPCIIVYGPEDSSKKLFIDSFLLNLFCQDKTGCCNCDGCKKYISNSHPDYIEFPDEVIKIGSEKNPEKGTIRHLLTKYLPYKPYENDIRVIVFRDAAKIGHQAETALLKTLEEPPEGNIFILICFRLDELKSTIISRSITVPFKRYSMAEKLLLLNVKEQNTFNDLKMHLKESYDIFHTENLEYILLSNDFIYFNEFINIDKVVSAYYNSFENFNDFMVLDNLLSIWDHNNVPKGILRSSQQKDPVRSLLYVLSFLLFIVEGTNNKKLITLRRKLYYSILKFYNNVNSVPYSISYAANVFLVETSLLINN